MSDKLLERLRYGDHFERVTSSERAADRIEELEAEIADLKAKLAKAVEGFEKLARLGNGDRYGNSDGNVIAQRYIAELTGGNDE